MGFRDFTVTGLDRLKRFINNLLEKVGLRKNFRNAIEEALLVGRIVARANAPVLTGRLRNNIESEVLQFGNALTGKLFIDLDIVPYARRQEFEHKSKAFFMLRGRQAAERELDRLLGKPELIEDVLFRGV